LPKKIKEDNSDDEEEKIETTKEKKNENYIDSDTNLHNLQEKEDVVFEFYYNRIKVSSWKTIYELINYQPTNRSVVDPYTIYYRIVERSEENDNSQEDFHEEPLTKKDEEENIILRKEKELLGVIKDNCGGLPTVTSEFLMKYISPYVKPDVKKSDLTQNYSTYAYNPPVVTTNPSKIGVSNSEQRLISKKVIKICEALVYILKQWEELQLHFEFIDKNLVVPKPEELFKNKMRAEMAKCEQAQSGIEKLLDKLSQLCNGDWIGDQATDSLSIEIRKTQI